MPSTVIEPRPAPRTREPMPLPQSYVTYPDALHRDHLPFERPGEIMTTVEDSPIVDQGVHRSGSQVIVQVVADIIAVRSEHLRRVTTMVSEVYCSPSSRRVRFRRLFRR